MTLEAAGKLLRQCNGDLQRAVNAHYDRPAPQLSKAAAKPQASPAVSFSWDMLAREGAQPQFTLDGSVYDQKPLSSNWNTDLGI